jgi:predicted Zn-dependent protease
MPAKPTQFKAVKNLEIPTVKTRPAGATDNAMTGEALGTPAIPDDGASLQQDQEIKIGFGRWHTLPADQPLQQRVHRIGMALVPAYQLALAEDDPSKIHFRFFAFDNDKWHGAVHLLDGAVLVPKQVMERLKSDDQLAAVLADGVAYNLQRQAAKQVKMNRAAWGAEIAGDIADALVPGLGIALVTTSGAAGGKAEIAMQEERLRIALALMRDAGYDPWQAPEAWRLLVPKKLPANPASLAYPDASCYQIGILNLQYAQK